MRLAAAAIVAIVLVACSTEKLKTPPMVRAGFDVDVVFDGKPVVLWASANDADGRVVRLDWRIVTSPAGSEPSLSLKGAKREVAELTTGASAVGLFVVRVVAVDDDGLLSEPDYVNVLLREPAVVELRLTCVDGCPKADSAGEDSSITVEAEVLSGKPTAFHWTAQLRGLPPSSWTAAPGLSPDGSRVTVAIPRVPAASTLAVSLTASVPGTSGAHASLRLSVANLKDEPPEMLLDVRQPGALQPLAPATVLLPGDGLHVSSRATDPNGDRVTCSFEARGIDAWVRTSPSDPCRGTVFPLEGGTLVVVAVGTTATPEARSEMVLAIEVRPFQLEASGPTLAAVAVAGGGQVLAAAPGPQFYVYTTDGARGGFSTPSGGAAAAVAQGALAETGLVGFAATGELARYDFTNGTQRSAVSWNGADRPLSTRSLFAGGGGRVFAATDQGILLYDQSGQLTRWRPDGGLNTVALTVGPSPTPTKGGYVWFAEGTDIHYQPGEELSGWPVTKGQPVGAILEPAVTALAAGPASLWDLWVGTGPASPGQAGSGLLLFRNSVDPVSGEARLNAGEEFFAQETGIASVAVERSGPYEGDVWAVAGERLVRVSRVSINDGSGRRGAEPLAIRANWSAARLRAVAVGGVRKVAVATDQGLLTAP